MTEELRETLLNVEEAIQRSKLILGRHGYELDEQTRLRTPLLVGLILQSIEHHEAMLLLILNDMTGSAFGLARSIIEAMYRGLWLDGCATEAEVERFIKNDEIKITMGDMAAAIDTAYGAPENLFLRLKQKSWDLLNSFTHSGMQQIMRRFSEGETKPSYTDAQRIQIIRAVTTCILVLESYFLQRRGFLEEHDEVERLLAFYLPLSHLLEPNGESEGVSRAESSSPRTHGDPLLRNEE